MKDFKTPFAYDIDGELVDYKSASKLVDYTCACGSIVRLRGGDVMRNHFYHTNNSLCSSESALHKAYKEVFLELKKIKLPYPINGKDVMEFERVELERKIDEYIPDAIGYINGEQYLIEFAKTSYINDSKERKIRKSNLFCLEIDIIKTIESIEDIKDH